MSLLDQIKADKVLSLNHWRYKLLHFAFGISPESPSESPLPRFLYTHYCPLFHLTNIMVVILPAIIIGRILLVALKVVIEGCDYLISKFPRSSEKKEETAAQILERNRKENYKKLYELISACCHERLMPFEEFMTMFHRDALHVLSDDEIRAYYDKYAPILVEQRQAKARREKKMQDWMVFWVNFSRVFFKWAMWAMYLGLIAGSLYFVATLISWSISWDWWAIGQVLLGIVCVITLLALITVGIVTLWMKGYLEWMKEDILLKDVFPFNLILTILRVTFTFVCTVIGGIAEFIAVFYTENCPAITIVGTDLPLGEEE